MAQAQSALAGIAVLDLANYGPGARCTRILADYGARVIKVAAPPGRAAAPAPVFHGYAARRGWQQAHINLKAPAGRDAFLALAERADVVVESFRPGTAARLGVGYEAVRARNPGIIYCATSGYGQTGPASGWAGHDLNYLAMGGYLHTGGRGPAGKPVLPGATIADAAAGGMHAALAIFAALLQRGQSGAGAYLDVSVTEGVLQLMSLHIDEHLATGAEPGPGHALLTGRYACYDTYACACGGWLAVAAIEPHFYRNLCRALDCAQWSERQFDDSLQEKVRADFAAAFLRRRRDDWVAALAPADTCVSPVYGIGELARDAHLNQRGAFVEAAHPEHGTFRQLAPLLAGMARGPSPLRAGDAAHSETAELLRGAGFGEAQLTALRESGSIA